MYVNKILCKPKEQEINYSHGLEVDLAVLC